MSNNAATDGRDSTRTPRKNLPNILQSILVIRPTGLRIQSGGTVRSTTHGQMRILKAENMTRNVLFTHAPRLCVQTGIGIDGV